MQKIITWENIKIEISYEAIIYKSFEEIYGYSMARLEIKANEELPITETGYRSHFLPNTEIEEHGGAEKFVLDWLISASKSEEWKKVKAGSDQYSLF